MLLKYALNALTLLWYGAITAIIYVGWMVSDQRYIVAESGIGYWLGILGGAMMLLLLVYPVRKRKPRWNYIGSVKFWFKLHMFLGVAGPVLIILHSSYRLGSLNGSVAFFSMLIVAGSGLIGRYLYRHIHHGLYGKKIQFEEIYYENKDWQQKISSLTKSHPELVKAIVVTEQKLVNRRPGYYRTLWFFLVMNWNVDSLHRKMRKALGSSVESKKLLERVLSLKAICKLGMNEMLFSYWHIMHLPLFVMLILSGITHVVVVHFY